MTIAWLAHAYTALGALLAFLSTAAVVEQDYRLAFFWLYLQIAVDATDGLLARALRVAVRTPEFDGAKLDDIVDYLCYVFVPALLVWRAGLLPEGLAIPVVAAMLLSSAYGFNRADAKTADHFFTGFPSYWNIVAFYLFVGGLPGGVNAAILLVLAGLVFVPVRYLYPSRGMAFQGLSNLLGPGWGVLMLVMLWQLPAVSTGVLVASLAYPLYYAGVSLLLEARRWRATGHESEP